MIAAVNEVNNRETKVGDESIFRSVSLVCLNAELDMIDSSSDVILHVSLS